MCASIRCKNFPFSYASAYAHPFSPQIKLYTPPYAYTYAYAASKDQALDYLSVLAKPEWYSPVNENKCMVTFGSQIENTLLRYHKTEKQSL